MKCERRETTVVRPSQDTPLQRMWISDVDMLTPRAHTPSIFFYQPTKDAMKPNNNFFDSRVLKDALSRVLVHFFPLAGRLARDGNGRIELDCNAEGVLFVVADTLSTFDDFEEFPPTQELTQFIPSVDYSKDISSYPLLILQVTYFKCGGVTLGVGMHHTVVDGTSRLHFLKTWSDVARGLDLKLQPIFDRTLLRAHDPSRHPTFQHIEYISPPAMKSNKVEMDTLEVDFSIFKLSRDQLNKLKANSKKYGSSKDFSTFVTLGTHVWRSVCKARQLLDDQETKFYIPIDGRLRLEPPLPPGYFGNAVFTATPMAISGDLTLKPTWYAASKIQDAVARMDNDYLQSALGYMAVHPNLKALTRGAETYRSPNLTMTSWVRLPIYEVDFGWGTPLFMVPGRIPVEGIAIALPGPPTDDNLYLALSLLKGHMQLFRKFFYDI